MKLAEANWKNPLSIFINKNWVNDMTLLNAEVGREYFVSEIDTKDEELDAFLFSLGCYTGEPITVISRRRGGCTVSIKDGRYNIDRHLADAIVL